MRPKSEAGGRRLRPEDMLEEVLKRGLSGDEALESELAALVNLASEIRKHAPPASDAARRRRVWAKLAIGIREHRASRALARRGSAPVRRVLWRPAFAMIAILVTCGILSVSAGAAFASGDALPGDPLYGLKRGIERAQIALSLSSTGDARLLLGFADERLQEAEELAALGRVEDLETALGGYEDALDEVLALADEIPVDGGPGSLAGVQDEIARNLIALERVRERVPAAAAEAIDRVIERATERQAEVEQTIERGRPGVTPPGQIRQATREAGDHPGQGSGPDETHGGGRPDQAGTPGPRGTKTPGP